MSEHRPDPSDIATEIAEAVFSLTCPDLRYVACCSLIRHAIERERRALVEDAGKP